MKVRIKKVHPSWNNLNKDEFKVGDEVELTGHTVIAKSGRNYRALDLCKSFSNHCSYSEIFDKVHEFPSTPDEGKLAMKFISLSRDDRGLYVRGQRADFLHVQKAAKEELDINMEFIDNFSGPDDMHNYFKIV